MYWFLNLIKIFGLLTRLEICSINLKKIYPNAICIPQGTDLSWMTEKEFDKWVDQVKEKSWGGVNQSGINS